MNAESYAMEQWDEMVFQNRNKDYGAYIIRQLYKKHVIRGVIITTSLLALLILIPLIISLFKPAELPKLMAVENIVYIDLTPPPPIEKNPAKLTSAPAVKAVDKYTPPEVVKNDVIIPEEPPPTEEVKKETPTEEATATEDGSVTGTENGEGADHTIYELAEQQPHFVGGQPAMNQYLTNNVRYPITAMRARLNGTVFVSFVVNTDGSIEDVHAMRGFFADCDKEAERVVRAMPNWEPGRQEGKPVRVKCVIQVKFKIGGT
ncbi:MAG TPA: TonB family protein [Cyclobacteriaceae bacterium]